VKILLIVNAAASSVTLRSRVLVQKALSSEHEVQVAETSRRGHAARLAQSAAAQGVDVIVVFGGDGTLNEAANGLAGSESALGARCRADRPTCSRARSVCPDDRSRRRPRSSTRLSRARRAASASVGQPALLPLSLRDRL
jgi:hypothetical protein